MSRITITVNVSFPNSSPGGRNYSVSFDGDFSKVREEVDKIYEKFATKESKKKA